MPVTVIFSQLVGFSVNWLRVDVHADPAHVERDAVEDRRERIALDRDLRRVRIDPQRRAHDDRAEVERARHRGRDHDDAERRALRTVPARYAWPVT